MAESQSTAVATREEKQPRLQSLLTPEAQLAIEENKARNALVTAIRGTMWSKDLNQLQQRAVAEYCRQNGLDPVRHVEVLGGNIYLTAAFFRERGAPLLHSGDVTFDEPDYVNADPRLEELAKAGDEWAKEETLRRLRTRIEFNVPEQAKAAVVQRAKLRNGMTAVGVNWCGGLQKKDPVGDAEPAKTAQTRAERRCWLRIADFVPSYGAAVSPVREAAKGALPVAVVEAEPEEGKSITQNIGPSNDPYQLNAGDRPAVEADEDLALDRELANGDLRTGDDELPLNDRRRRETD